MFGTVEYIKRIGGTREWYVRHDGTVGWGNYKFYTTEYPDELSVFVRWQELQKEHNRDG